VREEGRRWGSVSKEREVMRREREGHSGSVSEETEGRRSGSRGEGHRWGSI
jgi:hypothetical protein